MLNFGWLDVRFWLYGCSILVVWMLNFGGLNVEFWLLGY